MLNLEEKRAILATTILVGIGAVLVRRYKCKKVCPEVVDRMIEDTGPYQTLADIFHKFGSCKPCVEYAQLKFPQILQARPEDALANTSALAVAMRKFGLQET